MCSALFSRSTGRLFATLSSSLLLSSSSALMPSPRSALVASSFHVAPSSRVVNTVRMLSPSAVSVAARIDAACAASVATVTRSPSVAEVFARSVTEPSPESLEEAVAKRAEALATEAKGQAELAQLYQRLLSDGELRAFGSIQQSPVPGRVVSPEDQLRITGLPTTAFSPSGSGGGGGGFLPGALAAAALVMLFQQQELLLLGGGVALALAVDSVARRVGRDAMPPQPSGEAGPAADSGRFGQWQWQSRPQLVGSLFATPSSLPCSVHSGRAGRRGPRAGSASYQPSIPAHRRAA